MGQNAWIYGKSAEKHMETARGHIEALVQGSRKKPYEVGINIKPLPEKVWRNITETCKGKIDSMQELLTVKRRGRPPKIRP